MPALAIGDWSGPPEAFALGAWSDAAADAPVAARGPTTRAGRRIDYALADPTMTGSVVGLINFFEDKTGRTRRLGAAVS